MLGFLNRRHHGDTYLYYTQLSNKELFELCKLRLIGISKETN